MPRADRITSIGEARRLARRRLPRVVFDYIDGGAEDEVTMGQNVEAFRSVTFRPRSAVRVGEVDLETTVLGRTVALPVLLAPCGLTRVMHPDGVVGAARAASRAGTVFVLSTVAGVPPEDLASVDGGRWFQLYAVDRSAAEDLIGRAQSSGYEALVVTVDTPALGKRERDIANGVTPPLRVDARMVVNLGPQVLARPAWSVAMARSGIRMLRRSRSGASTHDAPAATSASSVAMAASPVSWDDVAWMRGEWRGSFVVKGVLSADDAKRAVDAGADAVVVSNHGGRQLDGAPATMRVLPGVVAAVGDQVEVLVDGGVRRGGDVIKALALGARAVLVGRPYLWALAAAGEAGVEALLGVFREEMVRTMTLLGCPAVLPLDRSWLEE